MADTVTTCPKCGNLLAVDSYGATSFAPVMPAPAQHVAVRAQPVEALGVAQSMMSPSTAVPPTMVSNTPHSPPRAVITPAPYSPPPSPVQSYAPTMQSGSVPPPYAPPPQQPYAPPPYPMMMQQPMSMPMAQQGTPGLAIASLVCGLCGLIPFWIGFVLCLLAITFGAIVLSGTRSGQPGRGLAITGLVCGLVFLLPAACGL